MLLALLPTSGFAEAEVEEETVAAAVPNPWKQKISVRQQ